MRIICRAIISLTAVSIILICDILGSFELNSQVSQHISTIRVLSALTISSLAPVLAKLGKNVKSMSVTGIQVLNEEDCALLSMQYCESFQKHIFLAFCNDFESRYFMFPYILLRRKTIVGVLMTSQANSQKGLILRTSKIHRKLTKIATTIIFSQ